MEKLSIVKTMTQLDKILDLYRRYETDESGEYRFKKASGCIVVLKVLGDTRMNECREDLVDKSFAEFRGNKFMVEKIFSIENPEIEVVCVENF